MYKSDELFNKLDAVAVKGREYVLNYIRANNIKSLNVIEYVCEGHISTNYNFYAVDEDGYGIAYNLDYIKVNDRGGVIFGLGDNDECNFKQYSITDFNAVEVAQIMCMLESIMDAVNNMGLPLLGADETFDDYGKKAK